ncbi:MULTISPECIES: hypothetical protein [unclassified Paenibacillus]|nr:hypothetical protein [Paenibacillus sp. FSL H7-0331]
MTEFKGTNSEGPSKPGKPESDRARSPLDPRSPGFDKKLDGPVRPSE